MNIYPKWILDIRKMLLNFFNHHSVPRWMVFSLDAATVFIAFLIAFLLRFNFSIPGDRSQLFIYQAIIVTIVYASYALATRSHTGLIRHTTLTDITLVFIVTTCGAATLMLLSWFSTLLKWGDLLSIPQSIILIHYGAVSLLLFVGRIAIKLLFLFATGTTRNKKRVLIYGAGELGFVVKRVVLSDSRYGFYVSGFIDDDKGKQGKKINGINVYGASVLSSDFIQKHRIESLIIAIKALSVDKKSSIIRAAVNLDQCSAKYHRLSSCDSGCVFCWKNIPAAAAARLSTYPCCKVILTGEAVK